MHAPADAELVVASIPATLVTAGRRPPLMTRPTKAQPMAASGSLQIQQIEMQDLSTSLEGQECCGLAITGRGQAQLLTHSRSPTEVW